MESESELIAKVQAGDREALAQFVKRYEPVIRARFREQFATTPNRTMFNTSAFFATVLRRIDSVLAVRGSVSRLGSPASILERIMVAAAADYKKALRANKGKQPMPHWWDVKSLPEGASPPTGSLDAFAATLDKTDSEILKMRSTGVQHRVVASALGMSVAAVRMRWHRIMNKIREQGPSGHA